jgi:hypothetical protein
MAAICDGDVPWSPRPSRQEFPLDPQKTWVSGGGDDGTRTHDPLLATYPAANGVLTYTLAGRQRPSCGQ